MVSKIFLLHVVRAIVSRNKGSIALSATFAHRPGIWGS